MSETEQARQHFYYEPPMQGGVVAVSVGVNPVIVDLTTMSGCPANTSVGEANVIGANKNPLGHFLSMQPDGQDVYYVFGQNISSLTTVTSLSYQTVTAVNGTTGALASTYTSTGLAKMINQTNPPYRFKLPPGGSPAVQTVWAGNSPCRYVLLMTTTLTSTVRMWQSSY